MRVPVFLFLSFSLVALVRAAQLPLNPELSSPSLRNLEEQPLRHHRVPDHSLYKDASVAFPAIQDGVERTFATYSSKHGPDTTYELIQHDAFPDYRIRLRRPRLCDPGVLQYSGYLDVAEDKHLFFWFFESRNNSSEAPLVLWLNGGPGCSSSTGLLFELGPCSIADEGKSVSYNKYSWNSNANMIILDQPVNVGWSYSDGPKVDNTPDAAEDVYAFLQLFVGRFKEYSKLPLHIAAESFGGRYAPLFAASVHKHNKALLTSPLEGIIPLNLESVMIGNGITDPRTQLGIIPDYACHGPYPIYDDDDPEGKEKCEKLREKAERCTRLVGTCYKYETKLTCLPATLYCDANLDAPIVELGLNGYDVRKKCDREKDGELCYKEMGWVETWMNNATVRAELGVNEDITFASCNFTTNGEFNGSGDTVRDSTVDIPEMLADGIRFLVYAGNADYMCNFIGNQKWMLELESPLKAAFNDAPLVDYRTLGGKIAGRVRSTGPGAGNFTFVEVFEAGHMVPHDQPEVALDMIDRWISGEPLTL